MEAKGAEMAAREECAEARQEMERCRDGCRDAEKEVRELRKDAEALRDENNAQRCAAKRSKESSKKYSQPPVLLKVENIYID